MLLFSKVAKYTTLYFVECFCRLFDLTFFFSIETILFKCRRVDVTRKKKGCWMSRHFFYKFLQSRRYFFERRRVDYNFEFVESWHFLAGRSGLGFLFSIQHAPPQSPPPTSGVRAKKFQRTKEAVKSLSFNFVKILKIFWIFKGLCSMPAVDVPYHVIAY